MPKPDPFGFDISVSSAKKKNPRGRRGMTGASETSLRVCDHPGCEEAGKYRAPRAPDVLDEFYWFCQTHARDYNRKWSFFDDTSEAGINAQRSSDRVWGRKTRPMGDPEARAWARLGIDDPHQVLGANATRNPGRNPGRGRATGSPRRLPPTEKRAIEILDVRDTATKKEIRKAYKVLIKILHPDMNGGDRSQEEQLQMVVWAWEQVKDSRSFKD